MEITEITEYAKNGCHFLPRDKKLVILEYFDLLDGEFASNSIWRNLNKAKGLLLESHPDAEILLEIPDLVARV